MVEPCALSLLWEAHVCWVCNGICLCPHGRSSHGGRVGGVVRPSGWVVGGTLLAVPLEPDGGVHVQLQLPRLHPRRQRPYPGFARGRPARWSGLHVQQLPDGCEPAVDGELVEQRVHAGVHHELQAGDGRWHRPQLLPQPARRHRYVRRARQGRPGRRPGGACR